MSGSKDLRRKAVRADVMNSLPASVAAMYIVLILSISRG